MVCRSIEWIERQTTAGDVPSLALDSDDLLDQDILILAKSYFDCKEFDRAAHVLKDCKEAMPSFKIIFHVDLCRQALHRRDRRVLKYWNHQ